MKGKHKDEKKNGSIIIIIICIVILIIGCIFLVKKGPEEEKKEPEMETSTNVEDTNTIEESEQKEEESNIEEEKIEENTVEQEVKEEPVTEKKEENQSTPSAPSEVIENSIEDTEKKAIDITKKDWGNEDGVYFNCVGMDSEGRFIIVVADSTTTQSIAWYHVNAKTGEFEVE